MPTTSTTNASVEEVSTSVESGKPSVPTANPIQYVESYTVTLPKTIDGYMICLTSQIDNSAFVENYFVAFDMYNRHKGDIPSQAEKDKLIWNQYDVLLAVNGEDIAGKTLEDVTNLIKTISTESIKMTFLPRELYNRYHYKSVRKG
jgi:hypothetical protein